MHFILSHSATTTSDEEEEGKEEGEGEESSSSTVPAFNASSYAGECFERESDFAPLVRQFQFWIKGIGLTFLGVSGLVGNLLSIAVLQGIQSNRWGVRTQELRHIY